MALSVGAAIITWVIIGDLDLNILEHSFSRAFNSLQFFSLAFIVVGLAIIDWAVTKLYRRPTITVEHTWMRELYPPATEEEYLMWVYQLPPSCRNRVT
jgi:hypothetical protein